MYQRLFGDGQTKKLKADKVRIIRHENPKFSNFWGHVTL